MFKQFTTKEARIYNQGKDSVFNKWCWENQAAMLKRMKLDNDITPCKKLTQSGLIKDLNIRPETMKLLEETIGGKVLT